MTDKEPSQRQLRVAQEIRKIIAQFIDRGEVRNLEGLNTLVTVTKVTVSPDLKYCTVWFIASNNDVSLGISLAVAIAMHNIPEGISIMVPVYYGSGSYKKAFLFTLSTIPALSRRALRFCRQHNQALSQCRNTSLP